MVRRKYAYDRRIEMMLTESLRGQAGMTVEADPRVLTTRGRQMTQARRRPKKKKKMKAGYVTKQQLEYIMLIMFMLWMNPYKRF